MSRSWSFALVVGMLAICAACGGVSGASSGGSSNSSSPATAAVVVTPGTATVLQGETQQFSATVTGTSNTGVTWSVVDGLGTITAAGLYTAPVDASGTFQVKAVSNADRTRTGVANVTVPGISITVKPQSATVRAGGTQSFSAVVTGLRNTAVNWTVQEAGGGAISNDGFYTAPDQTGIYHVTATSVARSTESGAGTVTVPVSNGSFKATGDMVKARGFHTATLLPNGKVLITAGANRGPDILCVGGILSAELYDPARATFTQTASLSIPRYAHTATLLPSGEVLITGGYGSNGACSDIGEDAAKLAELYNVATGTFRTTGATSVARGGHTATLLRNGKVLIVGGTDLGGGPFPYYGGRSTNSAELYDPATGKFTQTGSMAVARFGHAATLLANGTVLITGGVQIVDSATLLSIETAEIYDPDTGTFTSTQPMLEARAGHTATLLPNGRVLIVGGFSGHPDNGVGLTTAELYDPVNAAFSPTGSMSAGRGLHTATLLADGTVLIAGGGGPTAEIYTPSRETFAITGAMEVERGGHTATLLQDGSVLVAGGGSYSPLSSAELFK